MAPISPAYVWEESDAAVVVTAKCRGATSSSTDAFSSPHYVSINSPPYFLELDLHGRIDNAKSTVAVRRGEIELRLTKAQPGQWGRLLVDLPKAERLLRRSESRAAAEAQAREQVDRKKKKQWDDSRFSLSQQMDQDRASRERLDQLQLDEKRAAAAELAGWQAEQDQQVAAAKKLAGAPAAGMPKQPQRARIEELETGAEPTDAPPLLAPDAPSDAGAIFDDAKDATAVVPAPAPAPAPELPPPRRAGAVTIKFTPKLLPAPARTKGPEGDADLPSTDPLAAPQLISADGLSANGNGGVDISQRDPLWLKDRGDTFFLRRDWGAAEHAYGLVLTQFASSIMAQAIDCVLSCFSNRAACRLQQGKLLAAADDCGHALGIMARARCVAEFPKSEPNLARCRLRLLMRRGAAYARAGLLHRAIADLSRAAGCSKSPSWRRHGGPGLHGPIRLHLKAWGCPPHS